MSAESAVLIGIEVNLALYRTFGAHFNIIHYPGLTAGPIIFRAFGACPYGPYVEYSLRFCNSFGQAPYSQGHIEETMGGRPLLVAALDGWRCR